MLWRKKQIVVTAVCRQVVPVWWYFSGKIHSVVQTGSSRQGFSWHPGSWHRILCHIQPSLIPHSNVLNPQRLPWMRPSSSVRVSGMCQSTPCSPHEPTPAPSTVKHRLSLCCSVSYWAVFQQDFTQESLFSLGSWIKASPLAIMAFNLSAPPDAHWGEAHIEEVMLCKHKVFLT